MMMHIVYISWCFLTVVSISVSSLFLKEEIFLFFNFSMFEISFLVDFLSIVFFNTLMIIVTSVFFFAKEYMKGETLMFRFLFFTLMFISSMIFFIFGSSIFTLLIGWDGLGVTSFFLVLFFQNSSSWAASMKTAMTNRLGDGFLIIVFASLLLSNNVFIEKMFFIPTILLLFLILGSFTKSAQFPFSNWLPAAMAAPTPISSLVHSSTLVTAGVFLVIRFSSFFSSIASIKMMMLVSGLITMIFAGLIALMEKDLKKVVALSTLSHLGLMMTSCSLVGPLFGFFHLIMHAIFKALLFINMGYLIISSGHNQDSRLLSLNSDYLTMSVMFSLFSMIGFYFFNGFLSKDLIIFTSLAFSNKNLLLLVFMFLGFCLTVSYSMRFFLSLFSYFKNVQISLKKSLFKSTIMLMVLCLVAGELMKKLLLDNYMFFYSEKMSFFIPILVLVSGIFIHKMAEYIKTMYSIESMFFLNFILGNWLVFMNNKLISFSNKEMNNTVNVLLESKISNSNMQQFSNSLLTFFFFLTAFFMWVLLFMVIL
uniref:NADH:ubiquinone reductase (H(+)-translocating) n=1 Tax=Stenostomum sthenum TaxID=1611831 RepID=A0A1Z1M002_9PLAT|nr:NADH dehydrogenase subunit 5 [Stenostomum sthenum]ARW59262.1 NADH dehydrogenase subunit 5 [Stenostomum sthenum]